MVKNIKSAQSEPDIKEQMKEQIDKDYAKSKKVELRGKE